MTHEGAAATFTLDASGVVTGWSPAAERLFGRPAGSVVGRPWAGLHLPDDGRLEDAPPIMARAVADGQARENRSWARADGSRFDAPLALSCLYDARHRPAGFAATIGDPSDAALAEALARSESHLNTASAIARMGSWEYDSRTGERWWSPELFRILEIDPSGPIPAFEHTLRRMHEDDRDRVGRIFREASDNPRPVVVEYRIVLRDGTVRWIEARSESLVPTESHPRLAGTVQDITARKAIERELRRTNRAQRTISECNQAMIRAADEAALLDSICEIVVSVGGYILAWVGIAEHDEARTVRPVARAGPAIAYLEGIMVRWDDSDRGRGPIGRAVRSGRPQSSHDIAGDPAFVPWREAAQRHGIGSALALPIMVDGAPLGALTVYAADADAFDDGEIALLKELAEDLEFGIATLRQRAETRRVDESLRESEARFRQLAENIREVFWLADPAHDQMVYISPGYETIWGRSCESLYASSKDWIDAIHPDDRERVVRATYEKQVAGTYDEEYRILRPDGATRWIRDRGFPVRDAAGTVFRIAGVAEDVTERRHLEAQLQQTQKLESIGILAGGVAHDFNNLLTVIGGNTELLLAALETGDSLRPLAAEIQLAAVRAGSLTRQLLAFSRRQVIAPQVLDVNGIVTEAEQMFQRLLGEDIELSVVLDPSAGPVRVDPGQLSQVILNLAVNARDAMPEGGRLAITTRALAADPAVDAAPPRVRLSVSDTGTGMAADVKGRLFEPFFTTKAAGRGTGLGLAVVHGIVAQSGGTIDVESEPGKGTVFHITLPVVEQPVAAMGAPAPLRAEHGAETVLVVEDDEGVRRMATRILATRGYRVIEGANGPEALRVLEELGGKVDLMITDVVMPNMSGRELAERVRQRWPGIRIVFASGYSDDAIIRHGVMEGRESLLQKPYTSESLLRKVREALE
ncbi:MAG TPA: PAS domain-containing protein [Gemmatimonadaceae bacterium]|nr:PAS domain-containing protein [Gemmatimonadaceae bacterium]